MIAEVEINGAVFTIKRELVKTEDDKVSSRSPMYFFWGTFEESKNPPADKIWQRFGYMSTDNNKSFSNVLFDLMGLPIVKGDSNITMHQILRLIYVDQESPTSSLFYYEHIDSQLTRETVADLLLGVFNEDLYDAERRLIRAEKEIDEIKSSINATKALFRDPLTLNPAHVREIIDNKEQEIAQKQTAIVNIRTSREWSNQQEQNKLNFQRLNDQAIEQRKIIVNIENDIAYLSNEIQDSEFFIDTLSKKINALRDSIQTRELLGGLPLEYCPECLNKISTQTPPNKCKLCKEDIDSPSGVIQARRMEQEIGFQINESGKLLEINKKKLIEQESKYEAEKGKLRHIQNQVNAALANVKSQNEETIDSLNTEKGFLEGELLQYRTILEHSELYEKLIKGRQELEREIDRLKYYINTTKQGQGRLKTTVNNAIKENGLYLLNNDLDRQDEFKNADDFFIDFSNNIAFLSNRHSKYSASSNFYLKVSARFALFLASLSVPQMRYPRFIFADNMEDKGIEPMKRETERVTMPIVPSPELPKPSATEATKRSEPPRPTKKNQIIAGVRLTNEQWETLRSGSHIYVENLEKKDGSGKFSAYIFLNDEKNRVHSCIENPDKFVKYGKYEMRLRDKILVEKGHITRVTVKLWGGELARPYLWKDNLTDTDYKESWSDPRIPQEQLEQEQHLPKEQFEQERQASESHFRRPPAVNRTSPTVNRTIPPPRMIPPKRTAPSQSKGPKWRR